MKREAWIDSCRFFAIFVIMVTHFLDSFLPSALLLWSEPPSSFLLSGLTGKFSVAFFFVLLGFFASAPRTFSRADFLKYALRRYLYFAFFIFIITAVFIPASYAVSVVFHSPDEAVYRVICDGFRYNLLYLFRDSFLFESTYNATLWCVRQLFLASLICRLFSYLPQDIKPGIKLLFPAAVISLLLLSDTGFNIWIAISVLGYVLRLSVENVRISESLKKPAVRVVIFLISVCCIKAPLNEGVLLYSLEGLGAFLLTAVLFYTPFAKKLLASGPFPRLGRISIGLFMLHTPLNSLLASSFLPLLSAHVPESISLLLIFAVSFFLCVIFAEILNTFYNALEQRSSGKKSSGI